MNIKQVLRLVTPVVAQIGPAIKLMLTYDKKEGEFVEDALRRSHRIVV